MSEEPKVKFTGYTQEKKPIFTETQKSQILSGVFVVVLAAMIIAAVLLMLNVIEINVHVSVEPIITIEPVEVEPIEVPRAQMPEFNLAEERIARRAEAIEAAALKNLPVEEQVWRHLKAYGLSDFAVAGIMGNIRAESKFDPAAVGNGSIGLCQWLGFRKRNLVEQVPDWETNIIGQLDFMLWEMETGIGFSGGEKCFEELKNAQSVYQASTTVMVCYERPENQSESAKRHRASYAQEYYDMFSQPEVAEIANTHGVMIPLNSDGSVG